MIVPRYTNVSVKNRDVWDKTNGRCYYCGAHLLKPHPEKHSADQRKRWYTIDHATPRSRGGGSDLDNLLPSCSFCNGEKGDMTIAEYRVYLTMRRNNVPYFSKIQLDYLASIGVNILEGLSYEFWHEKRQGGANSHER